MDDGSELENNILANGQGLEVFYLNSTLNFGILPVLVFQLLEVCYMVDRLLTGITAQQKGTTALYCSQYLSLVLMPNSNFKVCFTKIFLPYCKDSKHLLILL